MNKVELLAPAGSFEALKAAIANGCDAVYLGGQMFGARAFANNFDDEQLEQAIAYAHVYGVRVFVTVNTLIKEVEMASCLSYIERLQKMDVDAIIVQDLGLFYSIRKNFPDLELHASTQMHIHNPEGIALLKELGASRVVVPREMSLQEIQEYSKFGMDLEVFIQGALCISYSGQCLMSALTLGRSGNRGECAQSCRMQYEVEREDGKGSCVVSTEGKYLLSPKDLNSIDHVSELIEAGIASFKIEGRMKRAEYVALMVSCYRKAIDAYYEGKVFHADEAMKEEMQKIFHRGFTGGHLFEEKGRRLMNFMRPNHMGITIGTILDFDKDKIRIQLHKALAQGDGIRILTSRKDEGFTINRIYKNGLLINHGDTNDIIEIDKTCYVEKGSQVVKTSDVHQLKQLQHTYEGLKRRIPVYGHFQMQIGQKASFDVMDEDGFCVRVESEKICEKARKTPLEQTRIDGQLRKSNDTPFSFVNIEYQLDNEGILPIKELNQMRREALIKLEDLRKIRNHGRSIKPFKHSIQPIVENLPPIVCVIHNEEQYIACKEADMPLIFVEGHALYETLKKDPRVFERTPRIMKSAYSDRLCMIQEAGGLYKQQSVITDTSCNVWNHQHANFLFERKVKGVCFSLELSLEECIAIAQAYHQQNNLWANFIYPIYGREEVMISEYCVINAVEKDSDKKNCGLCQQAKYRLIDLKKHAYPILCDDDCRMHILNEHPRNQLHEIQDAMAHHITSFLCVFTDEDKNACTHILKQIKKEMSHER